VISVLHGEALKKVDAVVSVVTRVQPLEDREEVVGVEVPECLVSILGNSSRTQSESTLQDTIALITFHPGMKTYDMTHLDST
jgi:hypothetical protein